MQLPVFSLCLATTGFFRLHPVYVSQMTAQTLPSLIFARHKRSRWITWTFCGPVACLFSFFFPRSKFWGIHERLPFLLIFQGLSQTGQAFLPKFQNDVPFFPPLHPPFNSTRCHKEKALFKMGMFWQCSLVAQGSLQPAYHFFFLSSRLFI